MNSKTNNLNIFINTIFYTIIIICLLYLIQSIKNIEPTIIYVQRPEFRVQNESIKPDPLEIPELQELPIPKIEHRYGFTEDEIYLMAVLLSGSKYVDGDGEYDIDFSGQDDDQQIGLVLNVVMNRVESDQFPDTVEEVIWAPGQFTPMPNWVNGLPEVSDISLQKVREWCRAYDTYDPECQTIPDSHLYFYGNGLINISRERWYS